MTDFDAIRQLAEMHAVYRMFDRAFRLLYVGKTSNAGQRFGDHSAKRWFPQVQMITLQWFESEDLAAVEERRAIAAECPLYNVAGKRAPRNWRALPEDPGMNALVDVLTAFGDDAGLQWQPLADRLAARFPVVWAGATRDKVSLYCRSLGVPSVSVKMSGTVRQGCRRRDVEQAAVRAVHMVEGDA